MTSIKKQASKVKEIMISDIFSTVKTKAIELIAISVSIVALFTSCSNQEYVEASYANNQKIILYSIRNKDEKTIQIIPVGENKKILSINIIFPSGFASEEEYIDSTELFHPNQDMIKLIKKTMDKKISNGEYSLSIPVRFITRYAAEGEAYIDSSIYMMVFYISLENTDNDAVLKLNNIQVIFSSRDPSNIFYYIHRILIGEPDSKDIDKMFEDKEYWNSINFVGSL